MSDLFNQIQTSNQHQQFHPTNNHNKQLIGQKKRYSCDQCSYSTDRRDLYRRHENIHKDEKPFRCYVCNKMFNRADHVKKHFFRIHKGLEYNVKLIKRINGVDYSSSSVSPPPSTTTTPTVNINQNGGYLNGFISDGFGNLVTSDNVIDNQPTSDFNCLTTITAKSNQRSVYNSYGSQVVFPKFKSINPPSQPHQRSLLTPVKSQPPPLSTPPPPPTQKSLLTMVQQPQTKHKPQPKSSSLQPQRSLLNLVQHQQQPSPPQSSPSPPPPSSSLLSSLSFLSSLSNSSPSTYNTSIDSDDDTTITTINNNNQVIIVICGKRNSNHKSIINHILNHNGLKRSRDYPSQCLNRSSSPSSSIASGTRKDRRKQSKPKWAAVETEEIELCVS